MSPTGDQGFKYLRPWGHLPRSTLLLIMVFSWQQKANLANICHVILLVTIGAYLASSLAYSLPYDSFFTMRIVEIQISHNCPLILILVQVFREAIIKAGLNMQ